MSNPVKDLISDKQYDALADHGLLNPVAVRNVEIRRRFKAYKKCGFSSKLAITELMDDHHLGRESIKTIVYRSKKNSATTSVV